MKKIWFCLLYGMSCTLCKEPITHLSDVDLFKMTARVRLTT